MAANGEFREPRDPVIDPCRRREVERVGRDARTFASNQYGIEGGHRQEAEPAFGLDRVRHALAPEGHRIGGNPGDETPPVHRFVPAQLDHEDVQVPLLHHEDTLGIVDQERRAARQ